MPCTGTAERHLSGFIRRQKPSHGSRDGVLILHHYPFALGRAARPAVVVVAIERCSERQEALGDGNLRFLAYVVSDKWRIAH